MDADRNSASRPWLSGWLPYVALAVLALVAFAGKSPVEFVFDDDGGIRENPAVNGALPFSAIFTHDFWGHDAAHTVGSYRPATVALFRAVWALGFGTPGGYQVAALLLHVVFVCIAFAVLKRIVSPSSALTAAAMVSVCAATSEAILSHVANADILCAMGAMLGLAAYRSNRRFASMATAGAFLLAIGSKESGMLAPVAWILFDWFVPSGVAMRSRVTRIASCFIVAIPYFFGRHVATGAWLVSITTDTLHNPLVGLTPFVRVLGAGRVFADRYVLGLVLPWRRTHDCSAGACGPAEWSDPVAWLGVGLWLLACIAPLILRRRNATGAAGLAWFAVFFALGSNFIVAGPTVYGERLLYLPGIGLFIALAELLRTSRVLVGVVAVFIAANIGEDRARLVDWQSDENITLSALKYAPDSALMVCNLAVVARKKGDYAAVEKYSREAISIYPHRMQPHRELAAALFATGRMDEARKEFEAAYAIGKDELMIFDYANFLAKEGEFRKAMQIVEQDLAETPNQPRLVALDRKLKHAWEAKQK